MKTKPITVTEYASRMGCSTRMVQKSLKDGKILPNTTGHRKTGRVYIIHVLISWYENGH